MDNDVILFTACDQHYFPLCADLIASLKNACGSIPRMRILDVGLLPAQAAQLAAVVEAVIEPGWDLGEGKNFPGWFRAMTSRPFLPKYASDAVIVAWIDSDVWVQRWKPVEALIAASLDGRLAIVEECFGAGFVVDVPAASGATTRMICNSETVKANLRRCYEGCFGPEITAEFGDLPSFNSGVFALRANSPSWTIWRDVVAGGLRGPFHMLVEQQALCIAIRQGRIPISSQPQEANFICGLELPWFSADAGAFTLPHRENRPLGIVHLTDTKSFAMLPVPHFPRGEPHPMPLRYHAVRNMLASREESRGSAGIGGPTINSVGRTQHSRNPADPATWAKHDRNEPCPCGSGNRYKDCHGRLA